MMREMPFRWRFEPFSKLSAALLLLLAVSPISHTGATASNVDHQQLQQLPLLQPIIGSPHAPPERLEFELAHVFQHGMHRYPGLHRRLDINRKKCKNVKSLDEDSPHIESFPTYSVGVDTLEMQRLIDRDFSRLDALQEAGRQRGAPLYLPASDWTVDKVPGPNVTDKDTVLAFARMAANAYVCDDGTWLDLGDKFNLTDDFGWMKDGLRGHVFTDANRSHVIISIKGTTPAVFEGEGTTIRDKLNDNLFFGCCCGQGSSLLAREACNCMTDSYTCNNTCVAKELNAKDRYWPAAKELYRNVSMLYEGAEIWLTGHSLGGSVASLLGMHHHRPVITFEAPGDVLPASRLGFPIPPGYNHGKKNRKTTSGAFHFGHNADPVWLGTCNSFAASCTYGGYALESVCHSGHSCEYDTVGEFSWYHSMLRHKIVTCIHEVYEPLALPKCEPVIDCQDCVDWKFYRSNKSVTTTRRLSTNTVPSYTRTRTETCQTPGWWGCLDETTASPTSTKTWTTSTSTSTCQTPGWFGCLDPITSTITSTDSTTTFETTSTCKTPGWFGCKDPTTSVGGTSSQTRPTPAPGPTITSVPSTLSPSNTATIPSSTTTSCHHPGLFWGCKDKYITDAPSSTITSASSSATSSSTTTCRHPGLFWGCWDRPKATELAYVY